MFSYINTAIVGGNIIVNITSDIEEPGTVALNETVEQGAGNYKISIVPDAAILRNITGSVPAANSGLIKLTGADRVNIDGSFSGAGKYLRFMNRVQSGVTLLFNNDADMDTVRNCILESVNNTTGTILFGGSTKVGGTGNDSNAIIGCIIRDTLGSTLTSSIQNTGISSSGTTGLENENNAIIGNEIYNFGFNAINLNATGTGNFWTISNNFIYQLRSVTNVLNIIYVQGGAGHTINGNSIGGAATDRSGAALSTSNTGTAEGLSAIRLNVGTTPVTTVNNNIISNMGVTAAGGVTNIIWIAGGSANITNNTIGGGAMPYDTIRNGYDNGIINVASSNGAVLVNNNLIGNITYYKAGGDRTSGITVSAGTHIISNNTIRNLKSNGTGTAYTFLPIGIFLSGGSGHTVVQNTVSNISSMNLGTAAYTAVGINNQTANTTITRNRVYNIYALGTGTGTTSPVVSGIYNSATGVNINNNQISVGDSTILQTRVFGIQDVTTGTLTIANNSIFINGAITGGGANNSYGIFRSSTSNINVINNIIYNKRNTDGTGGSFTLGSTNAVTSANLNYNLLLAKDTASLVQLGGLSYGWRDLTTLYTSTYNTNWAEKSTTVLAHNLFIDTLVGNLGIITSNPEAWYANGKGESLISLSGDFNNATGVRSTSIASGAVDIGSVEFTPSTIPPIAFADKTPAANDSTQFFFGSRMIAKTVWGTLGSLPSAVDVRYYSGVNPSNTISGSTFMNAYWDMQATSGSGYDYSLTLMQDSAVHGTIGSVANLQVAKYLGTGTNWTKIATTTVNNVTGFMNAPATNTLGIFTGTNGLTNPLPITLTVFNGKAIGYDALLSWTTASELNSKGFELERSIDGKQFEFVTFVKSAGNSHIKNSYNYSDVNALNLNNTIYYRLKMVDMDGEFEYSTVVKVSANTLTEDVVAVYPNPFNNNCNVSITSTKDGAATIEVYDLQGRKMLDQTTTITNGTTIVNINESNSLNAGVYMVRIIANGTVSVIKVVKQ